MKSWKHAISKLRIHDSHHIIVSYICHLTKGYSVEAEEKGNGKRLQESFEQFDGRVSLA